MLDFLGNLQRTHTNGQLRPSDAGARVVLMGWVNRRRDLGNLIFIDLRDRTGIIQLVFDAEYKDIHEKASGLRSEYVIAVVGTVKMREPNTINKNVATGEIEIVASELRILNEAKTPPFSLADDEVANEEVRLKYRYLDLRRGSLQANIELRHKVAMAIRNDLAARGFFEIETPFMTRSTPEGARDYLVPSRVHPGSFYALPQSPQLFKQILMISGFDKYFQIVRCFRDEDLRADRQPEFTQIDLEMTYPQQETIFGVVEGFLAAAFKSAGHDLKTPFPRMTYDQAIAQYGSDKPDLRLPAMTDVRDIIDKDDWARLQANPKSPVLAIVMPGVGSVSNKQLTEDKKLLLECATPAVHLIDRKFFDKAVPGGYDKLCKKLCAGEGDLVYVVAVGIKGVTTDAAKAEEEFTPGKFSPLALAPDNKKFYQWVGGFRLELGRKYSSLHKLFEKTGDVSKDFRWIWVTDFPMFEWDEDGKRWAAAHHPFTSPHEEDLKSGRLESDPGAVRALAYDVVLNGTELGSGSIRIHRQDIQKQIFRALGMTDEEAKSRFGFFLDALEFGTPPHGGIALGLDRIVMILAGADSLREVIPFPKTAQAKDLMVDAPTPVSEQQLKELGIKERN